MVDAILGALGLPDIGQIFPDTDPKWKGAASSVFVKEAVSVTALFLVLYKFDAWNSVSPFNFMNLLFSMLDS